MRVSLRARFGAHPAGLWIVKHIVSPIDRLVARISRGHLPLLSSLAVPTLLLTVAGRRTGVERTTPLVYVRDGGNFIVANARPAGERRNPWVLNLRAAGRAHIEVGRRVLVVLAGELDAEETGQWWPSLTRVWPAFAEQYAATGERTVFVLEPAAGRTAEPLTDAAARADEQRVGREPRLECHD